MLPKVGTTIGGKYALEAVIGRGGMGAVYRAKNVLTGRRVALKWILPTLNGADEMRARLLREARAMGRIEHPNVCAVYDVGQDGEAIYLVMELLSGRTLRSMMEEHRLEIAEVCQILIAAMQGVSAAHRAGVVHRDLKPDNLFVCFDGEGQRGTTKVLDFGVSKILDLSESDGLTKSGMAVGTPHYMSPEQIIGAKDVDARSDVYALGTILYQALAGRLPFDAENYSALVVQIATGAPDPLEKHASEEGAKLAPIVHRAIARQPADRYDDVAEMARALEPFAAGPRFETPRPRPRSVPPAALPEIAPSDDIEVALGPTSQAPSSRAPTSQAPSGTSESAPRRDPGPTQAGRRGDRMPTAPTLAAAVDPETGELTPAPSAAIPSRPELRAGARTSPNSWAIGVGALVVLVLAGVGLWSWRGAAPTRAVTTASAPSVATSEPPRPVGTSAVRTSATSATSLTAGALVAEPARGREPQPTLDTPSTDHDTDTHESALPGTEDAAGSATDVASDEGHDRLAPQGGARGPRHPRVVSLTAPETTSQGTSAVTSPGTSPGMSSSLEAQGAMEPVRETTRDVAAMTATGRSGTISTSDFE